MLLLLIFDAYTTSTKTIIMKKFHNQKKLAFMSLKKVKSVAVAVLTFCVLLADSLPAFAQNTVRGKITDETGLPVEGAAVTVKGTTAGTVTGKKGEFSVPASRGAVLLISHVSYGEKQVIVGDNNNLNISLSLLGRELADVVVIGYGTQRKKDVTGSTVSVKGETLNEIKASNIFNQLQGRAAGVDIVSNSAQIDLQDKSAFAVTVRLLVTIIH